MELLEQLRERIVSALNAQRPAFSSFALDTETLKDVEVMKATPKKLYLLLGDSPRDVEWYRLPAPQVAAMAETVKLTGNDDRLALGILCHHAQLPTLAMRYLASLAGTPLADQAKRILESTA